jgi:hypothetical protein
MSANILELIKYEGVNKLGGLTRIDVFIFHFISLYIEDSMVIGLVSWQNNFVILI